MRMSSSRDGRVDPSLPNQQSASSSSSSKEANSLKSQQPVPSSSRRKCFDPYNPHPLYRLGILSSVTEECDSDSRSEVEIKKPQKIRISRIPLTSASGPTVAITTDPVGVSQALQIPRNVSTTNQVPCKSVPLVPVVMNSNGRAFYTASAGKKLSLDQAAQNQRKNEVKLRKAEITNKNQGKSKQGKTGESLTGVGIVSKVGPVEELAKLSGVDNTMDRDSTPHDLLLSPDPESGGRSDAFSFLFTILLKEMEEAKDRIGELQLEQKDLTHKVLRKQKQLNLLQSAMTNNKSANQIPPRHSESTTKPTSAEMKGTTEQMDEEILKDPSELTIPLASSVEFWNLMFQLEKNELGDTEVVPSVPNPKVVPSVPNPKVSVDKRKRKYSDESKPKKKDKQTSSVEKLE